MQIHIWKNQHPNRSAKTSSVFPLHKHIPMQHTFQHIDSTYLCMSTGESTPVHCMLQAQDHKTKTVQCKQQPRNNTQLQTGLFYGLITACISRGAKGIKQPSLQGSLVEGCRARSRFFSPWNCHKKKKNLEK